MIPSSRPPFLLRLFPVFANPGFRWLWASNAAASLGMSMEMLAQGWLVLETTESAFWVGAVAGLQGVGQVSFGAIGGVIADRFDRRHGLAASLFLRGCVSLLLGVAVVTGNVSLGMILAAAFVQGTLQAVNLPTNNALIYDVAGRARLLNATAARMMAFSLARIPGSLIAGFLISQAGVGWCYLVLAGSMYAGALPLVRVPRGQRAVPSQASLWRTLEEGVRYALGNRRVGSLLFLSLLMEAFGFSFHIMLPVMARDVLGVGATGLGVLSAAWSAGALVSLFVLTALQDYKALGAFMAVNAAGAGLSLLFFALSPWFLLSVGLAALIGATLFAYDVTMASLLQLLSSDAMRGRVLGLYGLTFGFTPGGGFIAGVVATAMNPPFAVGMGGTIILVWVLRIWSSVRRYRRDEDTA